MAKQVNLKNLQDSLTRTKQYIDDKGGAMVYRTATTLFSSTGAIAQGQVLNLSQSLADFDAITVTFALNQDNIVTNEYNVSEIDTNTTFNAVIPADFNGDAWLAVRLKRISDTSIIVELLTKGSGWSQYSANILSIKGINYVPMENYSTTEQVVGTWIDGRPLYQKTINFGAMPTNTKKSIDHGISNIDVVADVQAISISTNGETLIIPSYSSTQWNVNIYTDKTKVYISSGTGDRSTYTKTYVTIKYTKTGGA